MSPVKENKTPRFGRHHADDHAKAAGFQNGATANSDRIAGGASLPFDPNEETLSKQPSIEAELDEFWPPSKEGH